MPLNLTNQVLLQNRGAGGSSPGPGGLGKPHPPHGKRYSSSWLPCKLPNCPEMLLPSLYAFRDRKGILWQTLKAHLLWEKQSSLLLREEMRPYGQHPPFKSLYLPFPQDEKGGPTWLTRTGTSHHAASGRMCPLEMWQMAKAQRTRALLPHYLPLYRQTLGQMSEDSSRFTEVFQV